MTTIRMLTFKFREMHYGYYFTADLTKEYAFDGWELVGETKMQVETDDDTTVLFPLGEFLAPQGGRFKTS